MATLTQAQLASQVLTYLGVKAQGQNPSAEDLDLVSRVIDAVIDDLRPTGAVYFETSAVPEWAQWHLTELVAFKAGPAFGRAVPPSVARDARASIIGGAHTAEQQAPPEGRFY
jgi:hypothetical protein